MDFDEHGLPQPENFRPARSARPRVTAGRVLALVAVVVGSGVAAVAVQYAPEIEKFLDGNAQKAANQEFARTLQRADAARRRRDAPAELAAYDRLAALAPRSAAPHIARAEVLARMRRYEDAIAACNDGLQRAPGTPLLLNNRAYFRALARVDVEAALADVEEALKQEPNASYLDTRAYIRYLLGDFDRAAADYAAALKLIRSGEHGRESEPSVGEIMFHRGLLKKALGDAAGMKADYDSARRRGFSFADEPPPLVPPKGRPAPGGAEPLKT